MSKRIVLVLLSLATFVSVSHAQSLADVAKKEEERRKTVLAPTKVYTNKDLNAVPAPPPPSSKPADVKDGDKAAKDALVADREPKKDQAYWAGRLKKLQDQLARDQDFADALQSRINGLMTDFVNRDDPAQRAVIEQNRLKSVAELTRLNKSVQDTTKAIADFQEEARRAGVPPGWLR